MVATETESELGAQVAAQPEPELTQEETVQLNQTAAALSNDPAQAPVAAAATAPEGAATNVQEVTVDEARSSSQDFATRATGDERGGLSNLEKAGIIGLGALAVGAYLNNRSRVISNSGDRVVVQRDDGGLQVLKDDDTLLRQTGSNVRTETFDDGSTRTTVTREDGSQVVTIRDASLRVLRRDLVQVNGERYTLIDDTAQVEPVDVSRLPQAPILSTRSVGTATTADPLRDALNREAGLDRRFSLAQVRTIPEVRALAPAYEVSTVTFPSGSAAITPDQAANLAGLAREVLSQIQSDPRQVFLVEGHTDAVGDAAYNLALSDRRAESLALALNEYFGVPVENMVVQGYGEQFLKVQTQGDEQSNRRATVRDITGLLQTAANY